MSSNGCKEISLVDFKWTKTMQVATQQQSFHFISCHVLSGIMARRNGHEKNLKKVLALYTGIKQDDENCGSVSYFGNQISKGNLCDIYFY